MSIYIVVIIASLLSAILSAYFTVFLLGRGAGVSFDKNSNENDLAADKQIVDHDLETEIFKPEEEDHKKILGVFDESNNINSKSKNRKSLIYTISLFFYKALHFIDAFFETFFNYLALIFAPVFSPIYKVLNFMENFEISGINKLSTYFSFFKKDISINFPKFDFKKISLFKKFFDFLKFIHKNKPSKISNKANSQFQIELQESKNIPKYIDQVESKISVKTFFEEMVLGLVPIAITLLPLLIGLHKKSLIAVLLYLFVVSLIGSYTLIRLKSPRSFWAFGISIWVALSYMYFSLKGLSETSYIYTSVFLCSFLVVYAVSSYLWYGVGEYNYINLEYALFVLHPLLYLTGIYLILIDSMYGTVSLLQFSIGALYLNFSETIKKRDGERAFVYVSRFVAFISIFSSLLVLLKGPVEILAIFVIYAIAHRFRDIFSSWLILPIILLAFVKALETTNTANKFIPLINERFFAYACASFILMHAYIFTRNKVFTFGAISSIVKNIFIALFGVVVFFGGTLEILDIKNNTSTFLSGISGALILAIFYLSMSFWLFMLGQKRGERMLVLMSSALSLYSVYLITSFVV